MDVQDDNTKGCKCPSGFKGDGVNHCEGIVCPLIYLISIFDHDGHFKVLLLKHKYVKTSLVPLYHRILFSICNDPHGETICTHS